LKNKLLCILLACGNNDQLYFHSCYISFARLRGFLERWANTFYSLNVCEKCIAILRKSVSLQIVQISFFEKVNLIISSKMLVNITVNI